MKLTKSLQKHKVNIISDRSSAQNVMSKSFKGIGETCNESALVSTRYSRANTQTKNLNHIQSLKTERPRLTRFIQNQINTINRAIVLGKHAHSERRIKTVFELKQEGKRSLQKKQKQLTNNTPNKQKINLSIVTSKFHLKQIQYNPEAVTNFSQIKNHNNYIHKFTQKNIIDQIELKLKKMKLKIQQDLK